MSWVKLNDSFCDHLKFLEAGPLAGYLNLCAIAWCNHNRTDGHIPRAQVRRLVDFEGYAFCVGASPHHAVYDDADAMDLADRLVTVGLWEQDGHDFRVHDYHDWQRSTDEIDAAVEQRRAAGKKGGAARWASDSSNGSPSESPNTSSNESPNGIHSDSSSEPHSEPSSETDSKPVAKPMAEGRRKKEEGTQLLSQAARAKVDQDKLPDDFPDSLRSSLDAVQPLLGRVASAKRGLAVSRAGLARTMAARPLKDHRKAAADFEVWWLNGAGQANPLRDVVAAYRNWLDREPDMAPGGTRTRAQRGAEGVAALKRLRGEVA